MRRRLTASALWGLQISEVWGSQGWYHWSMRSACRGGCDDGDRCMDSLFSGKVRRAREAGFTMSELLVVVGVVGVLAALFSISLNRATVFARSAACKSNLRQQGLALAMYLSDFHRYPLSQDARVVVESVRSGGQSVALGAWATVLRPYVSAQHRGLKPFGSLEHSIVPFASRKHSGPVRLSRRRATSRERAARSGP